MSASCSVAVSVVLPTHNRAHLVDRAIRSVQAQTISDWELFVVDDGSTDATPATVSAHADPRLALLRLARNGGVSAARNAGIRAARGAWVAFLDDDNEWLPGKLERQLARAATWEGSRDPLIYAAHLRRRGAIQQMVPTAGVMLGEDAFQRIVCGWHPIMSGVILRRSTLLEVGGFDEALASFEDLDFYLRLAAAGVPFVPEPAPLVIRHEHGDRQISQDPRRLASGLTILERKWAASIETRSGRREARRWRARRRSFVGLMEVKDAADQAEWQRAWLTCAKMARFAPWSGRSVLYALAYLVLGRDRYDTLAGARDRLPGGRPCVPPAPGRPDPSGEGSGQA